MLDVSQTAANLEFYLLSHKRGYDEGWMPDPYILITQPHHQEAAQELAKKGRAVIDGSYVKAL